MMRAALAGALGLSLALSACGQDNAAPGTDSERGNAEAIMPLDALQRLHLIGAVTLIDIRTPTEWRMTGVPPHAKRANYNAPNFMAEIERITDGDKRKPITLICRSGNRSASAQAELLAAGYTQVTNVSVGIKGWRAAGLKLEDCKC